jgi:hypothetical protein
MSAYIVLTESRHDGWTAANITYADARRLLKVEDRVFYIFRCARPPVELRLHFPFSEHYECLSINTYDQNDQFEDDDYVTITITGPTLTVTHRT